jgi:hypothetical protein
MICIYGIRSICMDDGKDRSMIAVKNDEDDDNDTHV